MATIKEIAKRLNITPTAVSYALNGRTNKISARTLERVLETARELSYQPHSAARALRTGRHNVVAVLIRTSQSAYYAQALHYMVQQVLAHPYQLLIQPASRPEDELIHTTGFDTRTLVSGVDGYFLVDAPQTANAFKESLAADGSTKPVISMGVFHNQAVDHVGIDLAPGTRDAIVHLIHTGRRRIAYLVDAGSESLGEIRCNTYRTVMLQHGLQPEFWSVPVQSRKGSYEYLRTEIPSRGRPDALLCINDEMAMGTYRALRDLGLSIPRDIAVVGCDGIAEAEYSNPGLSTIIQPIEEMCRLAWTFFERRLRDEKLPVQGALLEARFVVRDSSAKS